MRIGILGTRGVPNHHGGFEQFAEYFSVFLAKNGHQVTVYNSHSHPYESSDFKGVKIVKCFDPENKFGTVGQFFYDLNCILDSRKREFDIILQLGYTSSSIFFKLHPKKSVVITNMDGLEWKRSKYNSITKRFLKLAEKLAVSNSDYIIADSVGIKNYLDTKFNISTKYLCYGASLVEQFNEDVLSNYGIKRHDYSLIIARLEPENNIETIIEGYTLTNLSYPLLIFGKLNPYGQRLKKKYIKDKRIRFLGANYNISDLNALRRYSQYYFHGHSVGGTNPSLLEAMSSRALIIANDNEFNKSILGTSAGYFKKAEDIYLLIEKGELLKERAIIEKSNLKKIKENYLWETINNEYERYFNEILKLKS